MKKCSKCLNILDLAEFNECATHKDGLQAFCKNCQIAYHKSYYPENKEDFVKRTLVWRKENPIYKRRDAIRKAILRGIKNGGSYKSKLLGVSNDFLREYFKEDHNLFGKKWKLCFRDTKLVKDDNFDILDFLGSIKIRYR